MPNGAQILVEGLVDAGVDVCFANPGTSEMHFVSALDGAPRLRPVLCLFEGVATGAADGYGRMAEKPACTLLHLGPGLAGGLPNLHNARRARTPVLNIVGDHALHHKRLDAPLESDITALARTVSGWTRRTCRAGDLAGDLAEAVAAAYGLPGCVSTLVVPADVSWSEAGKGGAGPIAPRTGAVSPDAVSGAAQALRSREPAALLLGGAATRGAGLTAAARVAAATGARLLCETFPARLERGAGLPPVERLAYRGSDAVAQLSGVRHLLLAGAAEPVSFFAYPGQPSRLVPDGCAVRSLAAGSEDVTAALEALAAAYDALTPIPQAPIRPGLPTGALTAESAAARSARCFPKEQWSSTRRTPPGCGCPAPPRAHHRTTG
ncbi:acetolactate synthase large subunit [Streptomyces sp. NPDC005485]|uniref:acetolactate synthase large subunit n=1 Tax=Streptomyces sp. NPDC005485 TaxID=3155591 RepID=UPI0033BA9CA0